jgi:predicted lipoprotein with Yx(FWY)xxD motif
MQLSKPVFGRSNRARCGLIALAGAGASVLAACSSGSSSTGGPASSRPTTGRSAAITVAVGTASGRTVLETPAGRTLYVSDQENGSVACTSAACTAVWVPFTVAMGQTLSAPASVMRLGTVRRPDDKTQVTWNGKPLYTFSFDHAAGQTGGDGQHDSFGGMDFSWHVASTSGGTPAPRASATTPATNGYGY